MPTQQRYVNKSYNTVADHPLGSKSSTGCLFQTSEADALDLRHSFRHTFLVIQNNLNVMERHNTSRSGAIQYDTT